jgi:hypothetical protein
MNPRALRAGLAAAALAPLAAAQQWEATFGTPSDSELARDLRVLDDGGTVLAGSSWRDNDGRYHVVRTDAQGGLVWETLLDLGATDEQAHSVRPSQDGGFVVVGSARFPGNPHLVPWVVKLDAGGAVEWSSADTFSPTFPHDTGWARGVELPGGELAVVGWSTQYADQNTRVVARVSAAGQLLEVDTYPPLLPGWYSSTIVWDLEETADGGFVATGACGPHPGTAFLWKFDAAAQEQWLRTYEASFQIREARAVRPLEDGGYLLTGTLPPNSTDAVVVRTDAAGDIVWARVVPAPAGDYGVGMDAVETVDGRLILLQRVLDAVADQSVRSRLLELDAEGLPQGPGVEIFGGSFATGMGCMALSGGGASLTLGGFRNDIGPCAPLDTFLIRTDVPGGSGLPTIPFQPARKQVPK